MHHNMNDFFSRLPIRATLLIVLAVNTIFALQTLPAGAADWQIPLAGNAFRTAPAAGNQGFSRNGTLVWSETDDVFTVYFHMDRPAKLHLALDAQVPTGSSTLAIECGEETFQQQLTGAEFASHPLGTVEVANKGYVAVAIRGLEREGDQFAVLRNLVIQSETADLALDYVKTNEGNMFYWGRRGPSVHLRYEVPRGLDLQYAYSEITVPVGQDPIGSYFMANGFSQGYFGIQVNGPKERRVLFSVWSPFQTDNPADIPADQRIVLLAKGPQVRTGQFGNEGSGGQSYLIYQWKAGSTYQFLTEVRPAGQNNTIYTSWFADKSDQNWRLIASFQ